MHTCAIALSVAFDDTVPQDVDVQVSTSAVDTALDSIQQDLEVRVCAAGGTRSTVVVMPAPHHESAPASAASQRDDDYVPGGYTGI